MKKLFEPVSTAWVAIITHKLRSILTVLGVVIGVSAVIALMSIGKGAQANIVSSIERLGSNLLFVRPGFSVQSGVRSTVGSATTLTLEDARALAAEVSNIVVVAPFQSSGLQVVAGSQNMRSQITGITPDYQVALNLKAAEGDFISEYDYQRAIRVAVIGPNVRATLFGENDAVGQTVRMGNAVVRVIGVIESKGASMLGSTDDAILVPLTVLQQVAARPLTSRGEHVVSNIMVVVSDKENTQQVISDITSSIRSRHQLAEGAENDFAITSTQELISTMSQAIGTMTLLLGAIAAISLLVGGIGVMNIMLVSVVERTREIGIRKALGAREPDIWSQFLIEATLLTFTGGIIGVLVGWGAATAVSRSGVMSTAVSPDIVLLALSVSVGVGLFFGFYPAWQASRLDPIVSLRHE